MNAELLVAASPYGLRAALVEDGAPAAFFVEPASRESRIGDLHLARPLRRMAGLGAWIVDIGGGEEAFLNGNAAKTDDGAFIVRVAADSREGKRVRVSRRPALANRVAVFHPGACGTAFSWRFGDGESRQALEAAVAAARIPGGSTTVRAAAASLPPREVAISAEGLARDWRSLEDAARRDGTPRCLRRAGGLLGRLLRDVAPPGLARILLDDGETLARARDLADREAPDLSAAIRMPETARCAAPPGPLFERHDCAGRLQAALEPEVSLPCGTRLTIEETRALAAVDVDSMRSAEASGSEAGSAIGREIRLRNLSGQIVIDFPGTERARRAQRTAIQNVLSADSTPCRLLGFTAGGLLELRRQRLGPSLQEALTEPAAGTWGGRIPSPEATAYELAQAARAERASGARGLAVRAAPALIAALRAPGADALEHWLRIPVALTADPLLPRGRFALDRA